MFELEQNILNWKQAFIATGSSEPCDVEELESHLREQILALNKNDLTEEESFVIATRRLGSPAELGSEFAKVNGPTIWQRRILWMLCGSIVVSLASRAINLLSAIASSGALLAGISPTAAGGTAIATALFGWIALLLWAYRQSKSQTVMSDRVSVPWLALAAVAGVALSVAKIGTPMLLLRWVEVSDYGQLAFAQAIGSILVSTCCFAACLFLVWKLNARDDRQMETT